MQSLLDEIKTQVGSFLDDAGQVIEKGNKAAGTRSRVTSGTITKLLKQWRQMSVQASKQ